MKSNFAAILLLFCLVAPLTGTFIWLTHQRASIRHQVKRNMIAGLDKDDLVLLKFTEKSLNQLQWEHSKEFEFDGEMYDIVETKVIGDTTYYWCWWDDSETKLNRQLDNLASYALGDDPQSQDTQRQLTHFFKSLFPPGRGGLSITFPPNNKELSHYHSSYLSYQSSPPSPPPQVG